MAVGSKLVGLKRKGSEKRGVTVKVDGDLLAELEAIEKRAEAVGFEIKRSDVVEDAFRGFIKDVSEVIAKAEAEVKK